MQPYRWPDYETQLLRELQRQQNNAQFCDTLLQTEGISVPTHSCILAALSPYLSQKLSASPLPPSGQKRQIQLQAVKAQTLLKLVGLLYSGELAVEGSAEQNDVLSAARQFGITDLVEGQKDGVGKEGELQKRSFGSCRERTESRKMQDAQIQAEMAGMRERDFPTEKRRCVSIGTQTVTTVEKTVGGYFTSISLQSQNITLDKYISSTPPPPSSKPSGMCSDGETTLDHSCDSVTSPTSSPSSSSNVKTLPIPPNDGSDSPTPQEDSANQRSSGSGDSLQVSAEDVTGLEDGKSNGNGSENTEWPSHSNRDEMLGEERGILTERRCVHVGIKNLAKMKQRQQMMDNTQFSVKVKLKRRTKGEEWEVVSMKDKDDMLSVLTARKQDDSNHKRPQADLTNSKAPPSSVQPCSIHKPETLIVQPAATNHPEPPSHPNATSDFQLLSSDCLAPNQNDGLVSVPQPPGPVEECDEQIEKLLEDIMMGLNILPNLERDCKKSHYPQPNHDEALAVCQVPATENERLQSRMHAAVSAAAIVYDQDFGTQIGHSSTDTAQNQPSCSGLSSVQPEAVLIQQQQQKQQQQQPSPQYHSSVTSMEQRDGPSHPGIPLSKSQNCRYPEAPRTTSALFSGGQKLLTTLTHYPACQELFSQDSQSILQFLPLTNENMAQSSHNLPCLGDLRLPRCLSPLEPSTSATKHQPALNNSVNQSHKIQPQPSLHGRPWLTVNPGPLQFPFSAITHRENKSASLSQDTHCSCWSKQWQKHPDMRPQNGGTCAASCTMKEVEERGAQSAGHQNVAELKSSLRKKEESLKYKQGDTKGDAAAPKKRKRKHTAHPQEASSTLAYKHVKVSDGTKGQINLSLCSVSLSSNNVLAKEREVATGSSNTFKKFVQKQKEPSPTDSQGEKTRGPGDLSSDQKRIRTRAFLKKAQETPSNSSTDNLVLKPTYRIAPIVNKPGVCKRGRGRPRKTKLEERQPGSSHTITEKTNHNVEKDLQVYSNLLKEGSEKAKRRCKKRRRNRSEMVAIPLKKAASAKRPVKAQANNNDVIPEGRKHGTPKRPRLVSLKEFQKIIKRQHSNTRKSNESQEQKTDETLRNVESEGKACGSRSEELTKETEMDTDSAHTHNSDRIEESHDLLSVTVDKNHNQVFDQSTAECGSTGKETSLFGEGSFNVLGEEEAELVAESEQPLENPDEAQEVCDAGVPDTTQQTAINKEGSTYSDTHLPQEYRMSLDHNLNPQTVERTSPPLSDTVAFSKKSDCDQEEEEVEEEGEVDVLLYSPDKVPHIRECEKGLDNMAISPEEEEEDDETEIDVTGDEAE
ncbi:formin-J isoform X2 [Epinephelus fuscoguttatus]|uniref:formin-J isoform X2 n=1 Tax=Epinephelus fuscoguttatus TaxID=293821 RepID=UPI0020D08ACE|nr:formin-J isoform X2 [Epinephelus fuscoguttatus]